MRYGPFWASQEVHDALQYVNTLWTEGMMDPGFFTMKYEEYREKLFTASHGVGAGFVNLSGTILNPIREPNGKKGRVLGQRAGIVLVSADCPNVDAVMRMVDYLISREGQMSHVVDMGLYGEDWEWADPPYYWKKKGVTDPKLYQQDEEGNWRMWKMFAYVNAEKAEENPPKALPALMYITAPAQSCYFDWAYSNFFDTRADSTGTVSGKPEQMGFTSIIQYGPWIKGMLDIVSSIPSYELFTRDLAPNEQSAIVTAEQRWKEGLARVVIADNFEQAYGSFLNSMVKTANWKPIYEKLQNQWEAWLGVNVDDREHLGTITWRPEWKEAMGW